MRLPPLIAATFLDRPNRFIAIVDLKGERLRVHVADTGRMRELLVPGRTVYITPKAGQGRKTAYDLQLVRLPHSLVSCDSRLPLALFAEAFAAKRMAPFAPYRDIRQEVTFGHSRLDAVLSGPPGLCYIELKSATLVRNGKAIFPDAPTERGRRHLQSLMEALATGHNAAAVFIIQRSDATSFGPNDETDPEFGRLLRKALKAGVQVYAFTCRLTLKESRLSESVPLLL